MDAKMALGDTTAGQAVISDLEQEIQEGKKEVAGVEGGIIAEPENFEQEEELKDLRKRVALLEARKEKLQTESNRSLMEAMKEITFVACGIAIGAGGVFLGSMLAGGAIDGAIASFISWF